MFGSSSVSEIGDAISTIPQALNLDIVYEAEKRYLHNTPTELFAIKNERKTDLTAQTEIHLHNPTVVF